MSLVVEDGTGLPNSNSYQSLADARLLAEQYAITLPTDDTEAEKALINGAYYLDRYESSMGGTRTVADQALMFPRTGAYYNCEEIPSNEIPQQIKAAQILAADDFANGGNAWGTQDGGRIVASEQAGKVSRSYFNSGKRDDGYSIPRVDSIMKMFGASLKGQLYIARRIG